VISRTFELYRRDFWKYVTIFLVMEAIIGVLMAVISYYVTLPTLAPGATVQQFLSWLPGFLSALITLVVFSGFVSLIFATIAGGTAIRMTSEVIQKREPNLAAGVSFIASRLLSIWAVSIITGIIVILGLIALVVPGIILAIMFSLAIPVLLVERAGVLESLNRSRKLVGGRWRKSLGVYVVIIIIVAIASGIVSLIASPISNGYLRNIITSLISAFYNPIFPIALTVYYYSNAARTTSLTPASASTSMARFCPSYGERVTEPNQAFYKKFGHDLRPRAG